MHSSVPQSVVEAAVSLIYNQPEIGIRLNAASPLVAATTPEVPAEPETTHPPPGGTGPLAGSSNWQDNSSLPANTWGWQQALPVPAQTWISQVGTELFPDQTVLPAQQQIPAANTDAQQDDNTDTVLQAHAEPATVSEHEEQPAEQPSAEREYSPGSDSESSDEWKERLCLIRQLLFLVFNIMKRALLFVVRVS